MMQLLMGWMWWSAPYGPCRRPSPGAWSTFTGNCVPCQSHHWLGWIPCLPTTGSGSLLKTVFFTAATKTFQRYGFAGVTPAALWPALRPMHLKLQDTIGSVPVAKLVEQSIYVNSVDAGEDFLPVACSGVLVAQAKRKGGPPFASLLEFINKVIGHPEAVRGEGGPQQDRGAALHSAMLDFLHYAAVCMVEYQQADTSSFAPAPVRLSHLFPAAIFPLDAKALMHAEISAAVKRVSLSKIPRVSSTQPLDIPSDVAELSIYDTAPNQEGMDVVLSVPVAGVPGVQRVVFCIEAHSDAKGRSFANEKSHFVKKRDLVSRLLPPPFHKQFFEWCEQREVFKKKNVESWLPEFKEVYPTDANLLDLLRVDDQKGMAAVESRLAKVGVPAVCCDDIVNRIRELTPKTQFIFLYVCTSDLSSDFCRHIETLQIPGLSSVVLCQAELAAYLGPFWTMYEAAAVIK
eukprot:NODE_364_length_1809_cov_133.282386_g267_i0.p1 GENE.NODE_364_length_1809_cov_133.282386_g267_i0~~NODE_364_length_1809_cov_133.282386_g267_i0.p1  ORF type:complete len:459 (+),score=122.38 NODE_364_length_1809_cov_133.282386_g267_i0:276-1652(+)